MSDQVGRTRSSLSLRILAATVIVAGVGKFGWDAASGVIAAFKGDLPRGNFAAAPCGFANRSGRAVRCGWLTIARDPYVEDGPRHRLWVTIFEPLPHGRSRPPVVYLPGGPGGAGHADEMTYLDRRIAGLNGRAFIVMDPRGTGRSEPDLRCPGTSAERPGSLVDCARRLRERGADLQFLSTPVFAADLVALRRGLGIRRWALLGVSYGTRVGLELLRIDGDAVERAVMAGPLPRRVVDVEDVTLGWAIDRLDKACAAEPGCRSRGYRPRKDFLAAAKAIRDQRGGSGGVVRRVRQFLEATLYWLYDARDAEDAAAFLFRVARGDGKSDIERAASAMNTLRNGVSQTVFWAVTCSEIAPDGSSAPGARTGQGATATASGAPPSYRALCPPWRATQKYPLRNDPFDSRTPVLVLAGLFDPATPPDWAAPYTRGLARATVFYLQRGHNLLGGLCPQGLLSLFLQGHVPIAGGWCANDRLPPVSDRAASP